MGPVKDEPEVSSWDRISVDGITESSMALLGFQVGADLVSAKIEINPAAWGFTANATAQKVHIKASSSLQVVDGKRQVKELLSRERHGLIAPGAGVIQGAEI
tara:strand:+ start:444 stop:749 length:306 start_codon:yes stop_codon:yes gene_type:complete